MIRTIFSFSPRKKMDINDLRDALYAYLIAKHDNGEFVLRIEDANQNEYKLEAEESVYEMLDIFGLMYDEGPGQEKEGISYIQSEHLNLYKTYAEKLVKKGNAYYCFCKKEELNRKRIENKLNNIYSGYDRTCRDIPKEEVRRKILIEDKYVIRQVIPSLGQTSFYDEVYKDITIPNTSLDDTILIKNDGTPCYTLASVVDDSLMNITHVIKDIDDLASTPKYLLLCENLGFSIPKFIHFPKIITNSSDTLGDLLRQGFLVKAIINYLVLLNWSTPSKQEFFTLEELVKSFSLDKVHKSSVRFDMEKLKWFNRHYIEEMEDEEYISFVKPYLEVCYDLSKKDEEWIKYLLLSYKKRLSFASEINLYASLFFREEIEIDEEYRQLLNDMKEILVLFRKKVRSNKNWNGEEIKNILDNIMESESIEKSLLYPALRVKVTGVKQGVNLVDILYLLGKDTVLKRLK